MSQISISVPHNPVLLALAAAFLSDAAKLAPTDDNRKTPTLALLEGIPAPRAESAAIQTFTPDMEKADADFEADMAESEAALFAELEQAMTLPTPSGVVATSPFAAQPAEATPPPPPENIPPPPAATIAPPPPPPVEKTFDERLIGDAKLHTYEQWVQANWSEESLIAAGKMEPKIVAVAAAAVAASPIAAPAPAGTSDTGVATTQPPANVTAGNVIPINANVDARGIPWDRRIHSEGQSKIANGTWKRKKNVDPALVATVEIELLALLQNAPLAATNAANAAIALAPAAVLLPPGVQNVPPPPTPASSATFVKRVMTAISTKAITQGDVLKVITKHNLKTALDLSKAEFADLIPLIEAELFPAQS